MNKLVIIFILILSGYSMNSQKLISLDECIRLAKENSISIKQSLLNEIQSDIDLKLARNQAYPSLSANSSLAYNIGKRINPTTNTYISESFLSQSVSISSGVMLLNGLRIRNNIKKALLDKTTAKFNTQQIERDITLLTANYYLAVLFAEENLKNAKTQYESSKDQVDKSNKLVEAGANAPGASLSFEAQMLLDEQKIIAAENDLEKAYLNLKQLLQIDEEIKIINPKTDELINESYELLTLDEIIDKSLKQQPKLQSLDNQLKSAELSRKILQGSLYPSLALSGGISSDFYNKAEEITGYTSGYYDETFLINGNPVTVGVPYQTANVQNQNYFDQLNNNIGYGLALQLSIPIYDNYSTRSQIQKSKLNIENIKLTKEQAIQDLKTDVQSAYAEYKSAKLQYYASQRSYDAQKLSFDNAQKQYDVGMISSYEYISIKNQLLNVQNNLLISKYDYVFKSLVLDFYLGKKISLD
ncbi:MAG: TolC family protein [Saprospiraceae bacterium]